MAHLKSFRLPSFTLTVRECTDTERTDKSRDQVTVMIRHKSGDLLECVVGGPVFGDWNEDRAARSAISFASSESCWNEPKDNLWVREHGEELSNQALCHGVLGKELRK